MNGKKDRQIYRQKKKELEGDRNNEQIDIQMEKAGWQKERQDKLFWFSTFFFSSFLFFFYF